MVSSWNTAKAIMVPIRCSSWLCSCERPGVTVEQVWAYLVNREHS